MADIYVRSTDGSDSDNGSTWALAKATLSGADGIDAAGDRIFLSSNAPHNETTAVSVTYSFAGSAIAPTQIISGNDGAQPPTTVATGATVNVTGNAATTITINGFVYCYGVTFNFGGGGSGQRSGFLGTTAGNWQRYESCTFYVNSTSISSTLNAANSNGTRVDFRNVTVRFGATAQRIQTAAAGNTEFNWIGGGLHASSSAITKLYSFAATNAGSRVFMEGLDLTAAAASLNITDAPTAGSTFVIRNCLLPTSFAGVLVGGSISGDGRASLYNCKVSGGANLLLWVEQFGGTIRDEQTIVRSGGATDGTTPISWKLSTNSNSTFPMPLETDEIGIWNDTTGSSKTVTVYFIHDSATALTDADIWVAVNYLSNSGNLTTTHLTDYRASVVTTPANQDSDSSTWVTTGLSNPNKQKLVVTFTPQVKGIITIKVRMSITNYTVYVDPLPVVS